MLHADGGGEVVRGCEREAGREATEPPKVETVAPGEGARGTGQDGPNPYPERPLPWTSRASPTRGAGRKLSCDEMKSWTEFRDCDKNLIRWL